MSESDSDGQEQCPTCGAFMTWYYFPERFDDCLGITFDGYDCECRNPRCPDGKENIKHPPYPRNEPKKSIAFGNEPGVEK